MSMNVEEYKQACLARWALDTYASNQARTEFLDRIERRHGRDYRIALRERMALEYRLRKEQGGRERAA